MTDVRDVLFQVNPFMAIPIDPITFFLEHRDARIGACAHNSKWISLGFGQEELNRLANEPISCSGTVMGNTLKIMEYLLWMLILSTHLNEVALGEPGIDQGVHNMLVHGGMMPDQRIAENGDGVFTMQHVVVREPVPVYVSSDGLVVDSGGYVYPVVHQYDRFIPLAEHIDRTWSTRN